MPFLHGFRRIIYEYQPLVDSIVCAIGLEEGPDSPEERTVGAENEDDRHRALLALLERESGSDMFVEGISYVLFKVAERGLVDVAEILLRYSADINFEDPVSYYNPLHVAVLRNRPNMVRLLVANGADIEKRDRIHESSPLDLASEECERLPCLLTLLDLGADVNAKNRHGKTPLLHAFACADGLTVNNMENMRLLLQRGADVNVMSLVEETVESSLVFLVNEALDAPNAYDAVNIGNFCVRATRLLLAHGLELGCVTDDEPTLAQTSLECFDRAFPLAVLLLQSRACFGSPSHVHCCQAGYKILFHGLQKALQQCSDQSGATELLEQAEVLLDFVRVNVPTLHLPPQLDLPVQDSHPYAQSLLDLHRRVLEHKASPPALRCLCRAFIRSRLQRWPLDDKVQALPLPDTLKHFLLPEKTYTPKPGWDRFRFHNNLGSSH
ncbi:ankyrin repeat and SOCS box protein 6 [Thalassophryne amazonica]|uniref:ankyrin repeat and SOCS box protein 6 n=1 Tax=Thalassophryne amazonica TaxID=390379 RepID=UPI00147218B3|nr:ankyrin repeat and SOCS box protein 6 [Thalassophryne amazonica]XP_034025653.1 ankyrin repeat and SOCS box protein 6 [Thalassophryne amazonica]XP_034025654.1 ankyrin repeat and SOCS box protein 6 [Thalassophryne amazonica]XP_034025655.1 ankyrin repeat and SOCS box protein 6 [Thalassophryne amazonica]